MSERMTLKDLLAHREQEAKGTQRVKNANRAEIDGIKFDSKREAARYQHLKRREVAGEIAALELQYKIPLNGAQGPIMTDSGKSQRHYVADFRYIDWSLNGVWVIEDAKGFPTEVYKLKRAILAAQGITVTEV